jgi:hypothetical protein
MSRRLDILVVGGANYDYAVRLVVSRRRRVAALRREA